MTLGGNAKIVITGGSGFIGSHLVRRIASVAGRTAPLTAPITVADLRRPDEPDPSVDYVVADLCDAEQAEQALAGADVVLHLAGNPDAINSLRDPAGDFEANVLTTFNTLRASVSAGVKRFVHLSSALVYGAPSRCPTPEDEQPRPVFPYACSKLAAERLTESFGRAHGLSWAVARPFVVYGPDEPPTARAEVSQYVRGLQRGSTLEVLGDPDAKTRDFIHVFDLVDALVLLAGSDMTGAVNIGTGVETSLRELVGIVAEVLGRPARLRRAPSSYDEYRLVADTTKLTGLGFRAKIALADGVAALAAASDPLTSDPLTSDPLTSDPPASDVADRRPQATP
jgi:UDP-glucose 4-epimerase